MRINKYLASCELGSRRKVEDLIKNNKIKVNNQIINDMSYDIKNTDIVEYNNTIIRPQLNKIYLMLNKPKCYITSLKDNQNRKVVMDLLKGVKEKVFPVGRLDYNTQGLLLLTNDGEWANNITHPSKHIEKTYQVKLKVLLTNNQLKMIRLGIKYGNIKYLPATIKLKSIEDNFYIYEITIFEGKNREIRNIFETLKVKIYSLKRIAIGNLKLGDLKEGKYRYLTQEEINFIWEK